MKTLKSILSIVLIFSLLFSLTGCIVIPRSKHYHISPEEVTSIQFYDLRSPEDAFYGTFDTATDPTYTLPQEQNEAFLNDFSGIKFTDHIVIVIAAVDPSFSYGEWVVRINFTDGTYTFYSCAGYGQTFDAEGNCISSTHFYCDFEDLEGLIGKYYDFEPVNENEYDFLFI